MYAVCTYLSKLVSTSFSGSEIGKQIELKRYVSKNQQLGFSLKTFQLSSTQLGKSQLERLTSG